MTVFAAGRGAAITPLIRNLQTFQDFFAVDHGTVADVRSLKISCRKGPDFIDPVRDTGSPFRGPAFEPGFFRNLSKSFFSQGKGFFDVSSRKAPGSLHRNGFNVF